MKIGLLGAFASSLILLTLLSGQISAQCAAQYVNAWELIRGDGNNDGSVNLTDVAFLLNNQLPPCNLDAADVNDDGSYNLTDGIVLNNFLFIGGTPPPPPPAAPYPDFGCDCTADNLYPCCSPTPGTIAAGPVAGGNGTALSTAPWDTRNPLTFNSIMWGSCLNTDFRKDDWLGHFTIPSGGLQMPGRPLNSCIRAKATIQWSIKFCITEPACLTNGKCKLGVRNMMLFNMRNSVTFVFEDMSAPGVEIECDASTFTSNINFCYEHVDTKRSTVLQVRPYRT